MTPLREGRLNESLLVFMPFDLALAFLGEPRRRVYARARVGGLLVVSLLLAVGLFKQPLWTVLLIPLGAMAALAFVPLSDRRAAAAPAETAKKRKAGGRASQKTGKRSAARAAGKA